MGGRRRVVRWSEKTDASREIVTVDAAGDSIQIFNGKLRLASQTSSRRDESGVALPLLAVYALRYKKKTRERCIGSGESLSTTKCPA